MNGKKRVTFLYRNYEGVGLGYLASYVRSLGHEVQLVVYPDPWSDTYIRQKDKATPMAGHFQERVDRELLRRVVEFGPDLICFSVVTDDYQWCLRTAAALKQATGAPTLFGGVHVTSVPERVVRNPSVDLVGLGEGERLLGKLLEGLDDWRHGADLAIPGLWYERDGEVHAHGKGEAIQELDDLPFPAKDLFYACMPFLARTYLITTSRGCPYKCTYCYNAVMLPIYREQGKWMRQRSVENVIEECRWAVRTWHPRHFLFMDDVFASNKKWVEQFAERYGHEIGLPFSLTTEAVVLKDDVVRWLKEAGLVNVQIGVQTLKEESKERIDRPESRQQLEVALGALNKHGVHYQVDHMLGIPGESHADQHEALAFYGDYRPDIVSVFWLKYYPKLPIIDFAMEQGILAPQDLEDIEEGCNEASYLFGGNAPDFEQWLGYNFLFGWLNLLPRSVVAWFVADPARVRRVAFGSFLFASALPRLLATLVRRADFRGRDHLRRLRGQFLYIAKIVLRDLRRNGFRSTRGDAAVAYAPDASPLPTPLPGPAAAARVMLGHRSGGKVFANLAR